VLGNMNVWRLVGWLVCGSAGLTLREVDWLAES
jgi:hypothetical protein